MSRGSDGEGEAMAPAHNYLVDTDGVPVRGYPYQPTQIVESVADIKP